tara:strand:- start:144 stop:299 length:156 start_codon:yes stop_codon:yes gene_type:complete
MFSIEIRTPTCPANAAVVEVSKDAKAPLLAKFCQSDNPDSKEALQTPSTWE